MVIKGKMKTIRILIIEDDRKRIEQFQKWLPDEFRGVIAKTAGTAVGLLERDKGYVYGGICLDHDLQQQAVISSDYDLSGFTVVRAVVKYVAPNVPVLIHSRNLKGARSMEIKLLDSGFSVTRIAMDNLEKEIFHQWLEEVREMWEDFHDE